MSLPEATPIVAVTGHRSNAFSKASAEWAQSQLHRTFLRLHQEQGAHTLNSGFAHGTDLWATDIADQLGWDIHAYLPFDAESQTVRWPAANQGTHQRLLAKATQVSVATTLPDLDGTDETVKRRREAMMDGYHLRNESLIAHGDVVVAVWSGKTNGGTAHALRCAVLLDRPIILIALRSRKVVIAGRAALAERLNVTLPVAV